MAQKGQVAEGTFEPCATRFSRRRASGSAFRALGGTERVGGVIIATAMNVNAWVQFADHALAGHKSPYGQNILTSEWFIDVI